MDKNELISELLKFMVEFEGRVIRPMEVYAKDTVPSVQLHLLLLLKHYGAVKMSELASYKKISRPQLTQAVNSLEKLGLVERVPSGTDRRITLIACSKKGSLYVEQLQKDMTEYAGFLVNRLTLAEQQLLCESIKTAGTLIQKFHTDDPRPLI